MRKWIEYVAMRRSSSTTCRHAKEIFVATRRVEVGPGVKMDWKRSVMKVAMSATLLRSEILLFLLRTVRFVGNRCCLRAE